MLSWVDLAAVAQDYVDRWRPEGAVAAGPLAGLVEGPMRVDEEFCREVADHFDRQPRFAWSADLSRRYALLRAENRRQFEAIEDAGVRVEPWLGDGQPYQGSRHLYDSVRETGTLYVFLTREGHGPARRRDPRHRPAEPTHPMRVPSGVVRGGVEFDHNDVFRAVHDMFGHVMSGNTMGPVGEFRATYCHLAMYSAAVHPVLFSEQVSQICWFFYGPHLRTASGRLPDRDEPGWIPPAERPYAEQKVFSCPQRFVERFKASFREGSA
jgi:hypothetical protein